MLYASILNREEKEKVIKSKVLFANGVSCQLNYWFTCIQQNSDKNFSDCSTTYIGRGIKKAFLRPYPGEGSSWVGAWCVLTNAVEG